MIVSRFLPEGFDAQKGIALIAGSGLYPRMVADRLKSANTPVKLIAFEDETDEELIASFDRSDCVILNVGQLGKLLKAIQNWSVGYAFMAGQIKPKRLFRGLTPDLKALSILMKLKERNAETIFGALANEIEAIGVKQLDARAYLDSELAQKGVMSGGACKLKTEYVEHGIRIAKEVARLDIGQGVVVAQGSVLAVEAFEGTDAMLMRAGSFEANEAIFVKTVKPNQDYRFDVPVFGMKTLNTMTEAKLCYAALESESVIILEREKVIREAQKRGIQIFGY